MSSAKTKFKRDNPQGCILAGDRDLSTPKATLLASEALTTASPYLTAREAAAYLNIAYSTFRGRARLIRRAPQTGRYTREALDEYAAKANPRRLR
jgi:hypothetical protein